MLRNPWLARRFGVLHQGHSGGYGLKIFSPNLDPVSFEDSCPVAPASRNRVLARLRR